jgi:predicted acyl esterase
VLLRLGATAAACCLTLVTFAPAAGAAGPGFTVTDHDIPVVDGPNNDIAIVVDANLFVPDGVDAAHPAPVVINAHGFNGSKATNDNGMNELLAKAGYVVFAYSSRGFGDTTGKIGLDSVDYDVKDVRQLIDWLAARPEIQLDDAASKDPRLGMVGPSYGGGIQLQVAGVDDRVDVIVPFITWHSLVSSLSPNYLNTDLQLQQGRPIGVFKEQWTSLFFASGNGQILTSPPGSGVPVLCPNFVDPLCQLYTQSVLEGRATAATVDILKTASPATPPRIGNIDIPTLLVQGQSDTLFTVNEAAANYTAIKANGAPVKMIWHNGGHGGYSYADGELAFLQQRVLAWFDRYLTRDTSVGTGPAFEYFRNWSDGTGAQAYGTASAFPVGNPVTLFLSADGTLQPKKAAATAGDLTFATTAATMSYSETSNFQTTNPFAGIPPTDPPGTFAAFATPPLSQATTVVGIPKVRFQLASTIGEAQLFAKLYDVAPDGSQTLVRRLVAPIRATDLDGVLEAQLVGIAHQFAKGHHIRLVFASTDAAFANTRIPGAYTLSVKPGTAQLTLPLLGASAVKTTKGRDTSPGDSRGGTDVDDVNGGSGPTLPVTGGAGALIPAAVLLAGVAVRRGRRR